MHCGITVHLIGHWDFDLMFLLNLLLFAVVIAGHTEVQVMLLNRVHSQKVQRNVLRHLEHLHEVLILAFPVLLVVFAGFQGPRLLAGGTWRNLTVDWWVCFGICGLGFVSQTLCAIRWQMRKKLDLLKHEQSQVIDVAERIGAKPSGRGLKGFLARLPMNQVFHVEFTEKEFQLPALPAAWDGLTILQLTDFHLFGTPGKRYYQEVMREAERLTPDLIVFTGDLMDSMKCLDWVPELLGHLKAPLGKYSILGNHDWILDAPKIRQTMQDLGFKDVASHWTMIQHQGLPLVIAGTERPWMGQHPDLEAAPKDAFRMLLSHTPDHFHWAQEQVVDLMLSGHNHGGQIILPIIGPMYTPSLYGVRYSAGSWYENGTLLHVSRGLAGGHPVRYNCPPEVTLLTLRSAAVMQESSQAAEQPAELVK
jgi:predicted MPP superfamily phosphohydrolase